MICYYSKCDLGGHYVVNYKSDRKSDVSSKELTYANVTNYSDLHDPFMQYILSAHGLLPSKQCYDVKKEIARLQFKKKNKMKKFATDQMKLEISKQTSRGTSNSENSRPIK